MAESAVIEIRRVIQDIAVERRLMAVDALREAQFCTLLLQAHAAVGATIESPNRDIVPPKVNALRDTAAALVALLLDRISNGATDYTGKFTKAGVLPLARRIESSVWEPAHDLSQPYGLDRQFDEIATLLDVRDWYSWTTSGQTKPPPAERP